MEKSMIGKQILSMQNLKNSNDGDGHGAPYGGSTMEMSNDNQP